MLPGKTLLIAGALALSVGGGVLVMGQTTQKAPVDQVVQETPTIEPSATPTEAPPELPTIAQKPTLIPTLPIISPTKTPIEDKPCTGSNCNRDINTIKLDSNQKDTSPVKDSDNQGGSQTINLNQN